MESTSNDNQSLQPSNQRIVSLQRRSQIAELIQQNGVVQVDELAKRFGVSHVTIRKDLVHLENEGYLTRYRGGAIPQPEAEPIISTLLELEARSQMNVDEKARIGMAAAKLVSPGDTVLLDAGTTVVEMVRYMGDINPLTVVTNALNVAYMIGTRTHAQLQILGGTLNRHLASIHGPSTEKSLNDFLVSKLFLATQALDLENGLTDTSLEIAGVKRAMIRSARQVILLADSSKFGRSCYVKVAPFSDIDILITDSGLPEEARAELERQDVEVIVV